MDTKTITAAGAMQPAATDRQVAPALARQLRSRTRGASARYGGRAVRGERLLARHPELHLGHRHLPGACRHCRRVGRVPREMWRHRFPARRTRARPRSARALRHAGRLLSLRDEACSRPRLHAPGRRPGGAGSMEGAELPHHGEKNSRPFLKIRSCTASARTSRSAASTTGSIAARQRPSSRVSSRRS